MVYPRFILSSAEILTFNPLLDSDRTEKNFFKNPIFYLTNTSYLFYYNFRILRKINGSTLGGIVGGL